MGIREHIRRKKNYDLLLMKRNFFEDIRIKFYFCEWFFSIWAEIKETIFKGKNVPGRITNPSIKADLKSIRAGGKLIKPDLSRLQQGRGF